MKQETRDTRVLAIDPTSRGFGYAVLEGPAQLIDWGVQEGTKASNLWVEGHVVELLDHFRPDLLVVENVHARGVRRSQRVRSLLTGLSENAQEQGVGVAPVSQNCVRQMFGRSQATNKEEIADTLLEHFPELASSRPPFRKPWMNEDSRMAIFDAVAFALTFFFFDDPPTMNDQTKKQDGPGD